MVRARPTFDPTLYSKEEGYCANAALAIDDATPAPSFKGKKKMKRRKVTPKRVWAFVCAFAAFLSFARVASLFLESYTTVRAERASDEGLLKLCQSDKAPTESAHMRAACLKARRDRASPLLFKASLRAVHTAWEEFTEAVGSPFKLGLVLLFLLSGLVMPLMPAMRLASDAVNTVAGDVLGIDMEEDDSDGQVIVLQGGVPRPSRGAMRRRLSGLLQRAPSARIEEVDDGEC